MGSTHPIPFVHDDIIVSSCHPKIVMHVCNYICVFIYTFKENIHFRDSWCIFLNVVIKSQIRSI